MMNGLRYEIRFSFISLSILLLAWTIFTDQRPYIAGLSLGIVSSLFNAYLLMRRIDWVWENKQKAQKQKSLGVTSRMCIALIAVMIALKRNEIDLVFTLLGLSYVQLFALFRGLYLARKLRQEGRG